MKRRTLTALCFAALLAAGPALAGCSSSDGGGDDFVVVNAGEPQNPLVPSNTNENQGGRVVDRLFAGLKYYDVDGKSYNELAQSIESADRQHYKITIKPDWTFTDGTAVTAKSFVDAWNFGALGTNGQLSSWVFSPIAGYDDVSANPPKAQTMSGLKVVDDRTFTVDLTQPSMDFELSLGFSPFYPLPDVAYKDMKAFGEHPVGNGPYELTNWEHNVKIEVKPNPGYHGGRPAKNKGLRFMMYQTFETAYADLLAGHLDALDTVPDGSLALYKKELGDRAIDHPTAQNLHIGFPKDLPHFGGAEGVLRRKAISMSINREQICANIFHGARLPARDFTASTLPGFRGDLPGVQWLAYNPDEAKKLWAQADAISPWSGALQIAYNSDGGHQAVIEAIANSVKNTLGIAAEPFPYPTFKNLRDEVTHRTVGKAFRYAWQGDYPSMFEFLTSQYLTGSETNDVDYANPEFDRLLKAALAAPAPDQAWTLLAQAQTLLLADMADIPVLEYNAASARSDRVKAQVSWAGLFDFENIEVK
ncbi:peptide ABC transporter substrate-binding protein [Nocardia concava]|uniref:peptide ABC transporter substrate-binding protein n=1 Tax=Nocardia concava TaxID=257281 RepID=UPI0006882103|nr:ABC transporter substrate-binding protein [Nocardia concava]